MSNASFKIPPKGIVKWLQTYESLDNVLCEQSVTENTLAELVLDNDDIFEAFMAVSTMLSHNYIINYCIMHYR